MEGEEGGVAEVAFLGRLERAHQLRRREGGRGEWESERKVPARSEKQGLRGKDTDEAGHTHLQAIPLVYLHTVAADDVACRLHYWQLVQTAEVREARS